MTCPACIIELAQGLLAKLQPEEPVTKGLIIKRTAEAMGLTFTDADASYLGLQDFVGVPFKRPRP